MIVSPGARPDSTFASLRYVESRQGTPCNLVSTAFTTAIGTTALPLIFSPPKKKKEEKKRKKKKRGKEGEEGIRKTSKAKKKVDRLSLYA